MIQVIGFIDDHRLINLIENVSMHQVMVKHDQKYNAYKAREDATYYFYLLHLIHR
jgi:uncharacterized membrane protein YkvA (DUF1232 family)